jgi:hypothetical protein
MANEPMYLARIFGKYTFVGGIYPNILISPINEQYPEFVLH